MAQEEVAAPSLEERVANLEARLDDLARDFESRVRNELVQLQWEKDVEWVAAKVTPSMAQELTRRRKVSSRMFAN